MPMTLMQFAKKMDLSPNWVRELIKSKRLPAKLITSGPVPYYEIPSGTPKPPSMQRSPARKGSTKKAVKPESIARRAWRAEKAKEREATKALKAKAKLAKAKLVK